MNVMAGTEGTATVIMKSDEEMMGSMHFLVIGNLLTGLFLACVFSKWAGISTLKGGAKGGQLLVVFLPVHLDLLC